MRLLSQNDEGRVRPAIGTAAFGGEAAVFYFFQRGNDFVRCEISGDDQSGYRITITEPNGHEKIETYPSSDAAHARWLQIQDRLKSDGWWGPHGRD